MRPEIDYTRQRTVAELLAEHGEAGGPGRRSRRRGDGPEPPAPPPPAVGPGGPPHRPDGGPRDPGPSATRAPYRGTPRSAPPPGRRDRPTEMIGDRPRPAGHPGYGAGGPRGAAPGADRSTASGPVRAVAPGAREVPGRAAASGPLRAVPPAAGTGAPTGRPSGPTWNGPPIVRPAGRRTLARPGRTRRLRPGRNAVRAAAPPAGQWEPYRGVPAGGPGRPRPITDRAAPAPAREQPAPREPVGRPFLPASPLPVSHRPAAGPARSAGPQQAAGPRPERVPDPGPATGAWNPFEFDDEDDEDGPETVVGAADARRRGPARTPRRDAFPTLLDGPATALDLGRRPSGPVSPDPAGRSRPGDGPATQLDVAALRRGDGPATDLDVTGRPGRGDGPATDFDVTGRRGDGPATDFDVTSFDVTGRPGTRGPARPPSLRRAGRPPAPGFGSGSRGRPPQAAPVSLAPAPARRSAAPAPPRVRPFARNVVDGPTELTDSRLDELEQLDDRTDVAPPRRRAAAPTRDAPDDVDDEPFGVAGLAGDGLRDGAGGRFDLDDVDEDDDEDDDRTTATATDRDRADLEDGDDDLLDDDRAHDDDRDDDPGAARPAQAWAGVVAQWLAGAVAGAVLWVLFRYLWRELPVVALAAAVLVTAGLVLLVRQLLHDVDRRTTGFAVLVGLLLTASPAVLVLLGR